MIDDDFEESPKYLDNLYNAKHSYDSAQGPVDYTSNTSVKKTVKQWDSGNWYDEDPNELRKISLKPILNPLRAEFNHTLHPVKGSTPIRYGHLDTPSGSTLLLGFSKWSEFQEYIVDGSQPQAKHIHKELQAEAAINYKLGEVTISYWLPRENKQTRPGYWAIIFTTPSQRAIIHSVAGKISTNIVGLGIRNNVKIVND